MLEFLGPWAVPVTILLTFVAIQVMLNPLDRWKTRRIPGPMGPPLIGQLLEIGGKPGLPDLLMSMQKQYGKVFKLWFGARPWVIVADPDLARRVAVKVQVRVDLEGYLGILHGVDREVAQKGLLEAKGLMYRIARRGFEAELMTSDSLARHMPSMDTYAHKLCERLDKVAATGEVTCIWRELGNMTISVVGQSAYGVDFGTLAGPEGASEQGRRLVQASKQMFETLQLDRGSLYVPISLLVPSLKPLFRQMARVLPDSGHTQHLKARKVIMEVSANLIRQWEEHGGKMDETNPKKGGKRNSFMDTLLASRDSDAEGRLTDTEVVAQVLTFLLAGYETTANALAACVYLLSVNPKAEARLAAEVKGKSVESPEDVEKQFPYVDAVLKEALRLLGPAAGLMRTATVDMDLDGITVPANTVMYLPTYAFHHSSEYWPRVDEFLPERFLPEGRAELGPRNPNAYLPFGVGMRSCIGYKFANLEAKTTLIRLYQRFHFNLVSSYPVPYKNGLTYGPVDGINVTISHRT